MVACAHRMHFVFLTDNFRVCYFTGYLFLDFWCCDLPNSYLDLIINFGSMQTFSVKYLSSECFQFCQTQGLHPNF
jgi:hypothetical protein